MRKHEEDQNATNHDNRSLTPQQKQFRSDEMGTTRKGGSHLCFIAHSLLLSANQSRKIDESLKIGSVQIERIKLRLE